MPRSAAIWERFLDSARRVRGASALFRSRSGGAPGTPAGVRWYKSAHPAFECPSRFQGETTMKCNTASLVGLLFVFAIPLSAQQPGAAQTPEQRAAAAAARAERLAAPRPIDAVDSVWIEELTYMEVRDAVKAGK